MSRFLKVLVTLVAASLIGDKASAAGRVPLLTISPFLQQVKIGADEPTKDFFVTIKNDSTEIREIKLSVLDFGSLNDSGGLAFAGANANELIKKYGLSNWLQLSTGSLTLGAGETAKITATIINDVTMQPGGHYGSIIASIDGQNIGQGNQISINQKLSALVFVNKQGGEKYDLSLKGVGFSRNIFKLPNKAELNFTNAGNTHLVPRGTLQLVDGKNHLIASGVINEESAIVLPEAKRRIIAELDRQGSPSFWPARYRLRVDYRYDGIEKFARKEVSLLYINPIGLLIAFSVVGLTFYIIKQRRSAKKSELPTDIKSKLYNQSDSKIHNAKAKIKADKKSKAKSKKKTKKA